MEKYISDFICQIYPDYTELALHANTEKECIIDATSLIKELRTENADLHKEYNDLAGINLKLGEENASLREALEEFGDHDHTCKAMDDLIAVKPCTCGYEQALKGDNNVHNNRTDR